MPDTARPPQSRNAVHAILFTVAVIFAALSFIGLAASRSGARGTLPTKNAVGVNPNPSPITEPEPEPEMIRHVPMPNEVRGIYWTAQTAGGERGQELLAYMKRYGLNTAVIDLKMDNGELAFDPHSNAMKATVMDDPVIHDLDALLRKLADEGIYRIARIAVMRDGAFAEIHPELALKRAGGGVWKDNIGSIWLDPAAHETRQYSKELAREAYERGFDEIQFDYVRFPSDGAINAIQYPIWSQTTSTKVQVMQDFFAEVGGTLTQEGIPVSFDVFGMTFISLSDFNIGQRLADVYPYAVAISPMAYPSHYPNMFRGYPNPALAPYEIVKLTLDEGARIMENLYGIPAEESRPKFRPWLQDFDIGAVYTPERIEAQIRAARDAGASGWLLWNARNVYEPTNYLPPKETKVRQQNEEKNAPILE